MQCRLPQRYGGSSLSLAAVTLSGTFDSSYGYVAVNGTTYTSAQMLTVTTGTTVSLYVGAGSVAYGSRCYVSLNGTNVQSGTGTFEYTIEGDCTITFYKTGTASRNTYCYAQITTS